MKKIIARKTIGKIEMVQYEGEPAHRWHRLTAMTAAVKRANNKIRAMVKQDLQAMGYLPATNTLAAIGEEIRQARKSAGLSIGRLAQQSGLEKASISRLESGKNPNPSLRTLSRLAKALNRELEIRLH